MAVTQPSLVPTQVKIVEPNTLLGRLNKLSERISNRAYEIFESRGRASGHELEDWFMAESEIVPPFQARVKEKDDALVVEAETPEFGARDLEISVQPWKLTISGSKEVRVEHKEGKVIYQEQRTSDFMRVIDLPAEIDSTKASATLKNGLLEINLPKMPNLLRNS